MRRSGTRRSWWLSGMPSGLGGQLIVRALLSALRRPLVGLRSQRRAWIGSSFQKLLLAAEQADSAVSSREREHVESWKKRTGLGGVPAQTAHPTVGAQVHDVACPACGAGPGVRCETPRGYHPSRVARLRRSR
ncbi:zinc finger domain-containing protein [Streptomyces sp. NRRL S-237]|uniref:zinc finger domain-containing protein n=1 Tax=Streptomyces sp. NRRL S-237 TaxID=1463895 RepID=UPI003B632AFE